MIRYKLLYGVAVAVALTAIAYTVTFKNHTDDKSILIQAANSNNLVIKTSFAFQNQSKPYEPWRNEDDYRKYILTTRGYSEDMPLAQAVEDFNKRAQQDDVGKTQPTLTKDEVLAAIRAWSRVEEPIKPSVFEMFQKIAKTEMMPKGSMFEFSKGAASRNGYDTTAWSIYLLVNLDKYPRDIVGVPVYERLIRMQYITSQPTKFK